MSSTPPKFKLFYGVSNFIFTSESNFVIDKFNSFYPANQILEPYWLANIYEPFVKITVIMPELLYCDRLWLSKHEKTFHRLKLTLRLCFGTLISDFKLFNRVLLWPITSSSSVVHIWFKSIAVITSESFKSSSLDHILKQNHEHHYMYWLFTVNGEQLILSSATLNLQ